MIHFIGELPKRAYIAVSGGPDSMAILDFMTRDYKRDITVLHVNHGTLFGGQAVETVVEFCKQRNIKLNRFGLNAAETPSSNKENYWREKRYEFFNRFTDDPIITCHNLDDCVETWLFGACHGQTKLIPYRRGNVIRPFLITPKAELLEWCYRHDVPYMTDPGNSDPAYMRSLIRTEMVPVVKKVNVGIGKVIRRKIEEEFVTEQTKEFEE